MFCCGGRRRGIENQKEEAAVVEPKTSFADKTVIVTGASSGIGATTAILFAEQGASVVIVGRNQTKLTAVSEKLPKNAKALVINADVTTDAKKIIDETVNKFGKIDILVNNAGFSKSGSLTDGKFLEVFDSIMETNVRAVSELTMLAYPHLTKTKGNVVNVSSVVSKMVPFDPGFLAYYISKAALDHFTKGTALEFAPNGVRVNSVNPGPVITDFMENMGVGEISIDDITQMTALKRVSASEEIAELILYLASDKARGITGSIMVADNGSFLGQ